MAIRNHSVDLASVTAINGTVLAFITMLQAEAVLKLVLLVMTIIYTYVKIRRESDALMALEDKVTSRKKERHHAKPSQTE